MRGLMQDRPLALPHVFHRAEQLFGHKPIVTATAKGEVATTVADWAVRVRRLATALDTLGVPADGRVATFSWNTATHLELYSAAPCTGAVLHTLNLRLFPEQLVYIVNHAEDEVVFVDRLLAACLPDPGRKTHTVRHGRIATLRTTLPATRSTTRSCCARRSRSSGRFELDDENSAAAMCYTLRHHGQPQGRGLQPPLDASALAERAHRDGMGLSERDVVMPVVPMFHVNAWGIPFAATMVGAARCSRGGTRPRRPARLIENERVTLTAGVPTDLARFSECWTRRKHDLSQPAGGSVGGSAAPRSMMERYRRARRARLARLGHDRDDTARRSCLLKTHLQDAARRRALAISRPPGISAPLALSARCRRDGKDVPWDGKTMGEIAGARALGHAAATTTIRAPGEAFRGRLVPHWRRRDHRRRGLHPDRGPHQGSGEERRRVDFERRPGKRDHGASQGAEAAVIAVPHASGRNARWPASSIAQYQGQITKDEILDFLRPQFAKWWLPDDVAFIEAVPKTSVGKFNKRALREQFAGYKLPE